ncbi:hypothetical protein RIF29_16307 [Crotalaria pallida]|uniref:Uncharacterized protein n=1 Tax=Crotalaria pallida TaxID=3830 RepID=A0AAN9IBX1_CROPI
MDSITLKTSSAAQPPPLHSLRHKPPSAAQPPSAASLCPLHSLCPSQASLRRTASRDPPFLRHTEAVTLPPSEQIVALPPSVTVWFFVTPSLCDSCSFFSLKAQQEKESGPSQFPPPIVDPVEGNQGNDHDDDDNEDPQDTSLLTNHLDHVAHQIWIGKRILTSRLRSISRLADPRLRDRLLHYEAVEDIKSLADTPVFEHPVRK